MSRTSGEQFSLEEKLQAARELRAMFGTENRRGQGRGGRGGSSSGRGRVPQGRPYPGSGGFAPGSTSTPSMFHRSLASANPAAVSTPISRTPAAAAQTATASGTSTAPNRPKTSSQLTFLNSAADTKPIGSITLQGFGGNVGHGTAVISPQTAPAVLRDATNQHGPVNNVLTKQVENKSASFVAAGQPRLPGLDASRFAKANAEPSNKSATSHTRKASFASDVEMTDVTALLTQGMGGLTIGRSGHNASQAAENATLKESQRGQRPQPQDMEDRYARMENWVPAWVVASASSGSTNQSAVPRSAQPAAQPSTAASNTTRQGGSGPRRGHGGLMDSRHNSNKTPATCPKSM
ncbi:hypothetical protein JX266_000975 [Neoarthrinium moseri]|nr:hypothetical protein JX266_000975 [Neoarthrinium moseri]